MASSTTSWSRPPAERGFLVAMAVATGLIAGTLGRELPVELALRVLPQRATRPCGMEEVLECTVRELPDAFGQLLLLGLAVVAIDVGLAGVGAVLVAVGIVLVRRAGPSLTPADWAGPTMVGLGVAVVVPGAWLLGSFALSQLR